MTLARAIARFITSEVLLPITIVCLSVLLAAQILPLLANHLSGAIEKTLSNSGTANRASVTYDHATKAERGTMR
jgi:hypothetical protein